MLSHFLYKLTNCISNHMFTVLFCLISFALFHNKNVSDIELILCHCDNYAVFFWIYVIKIEINFKQFVIRLLFAYIAYGYWIGRDNCRNKVVCIVLHCRFREVFFWKKAFRKRFCIFFQSEVSDWHLFTEKVVKHIILE